MPFLIVGSYNLAKFFYSETVVYHQVVYLSITVPIEVI